MQDINRFMQLIIVCIQLSIGFPFNVKSYKVIEIQAFQQKPSQPQKL
jgi:hypothetical protein